MKNKTLLVSLTVALFLVGCSDPKTATIPSDPNKWESDLKPAASKLSDDDRATLTRFLVRTKMAEAFGGKSMPTGLTIGNALKQQKDFEEEKKKEQQEADLLKAKVETERAALKKQVDTILTVALVNKAFHKADYQSNQFRDQIEYLIAFQNKGQKDIVGVKGKAIFTDIFGDPIKKLNISYDHSIQAGQTNQWDGASDFNQFENDDVKLANTSLEKIKFAFSPEVVLFSDGTKMELKDAPTN